MVKTRIYSASLEILPEGFQDWERGRRDIHWRDLIQDEMPDWLKRSRIFMDNSNPSVEYYAGTYKDVNLGQMYRFSQEGDYPGREGENLEVFLKKVKNKILTNKEYSSVLIDVFENGRTNKEILLKKFESQKSKVQELIKKGVLKSSEVKDMLILDVSQLLELNS